MDRLSWNIGGIGNVMNRTRCISCENAIDYISNMCAHIQTRSSHIVNLFYNSTYALQYNIILYAHNTCRSNIIVLCIAIYVTRSLILYVQVITVGTSSKCAYTYVSTAVVQCTLL